MQWQTWLANNQPWDDHYNVPRQIQEILKQLVTEAVYTENTTLQQICDGRHILL